MCEDRGFRGGSFGRGRVAPNLHLKRGEGWSLGKNRKWWFERFSNVTLLRCLKNPRCFCTPVLTEIQMQRGQTLVYLHRSGKHTPGGFQNLLTLHGRLEGKPEWELSSVYFFALPLEHTALCAGASHTVLLGGPNSVLNGVSRSNHKLGRKMNSYQSWKWRDLFVASAFFTNKWNSLLTVYISRE